MSIINFKEDASASIFNKALKLEDALLVLTWIDSKKKKGRKGFAYEIDGNPVLSKDDAVSLKATFVHNKWCKKDAKLSELAYDANKDLYAFVAFSELLVVAGMENAAEEEDASVDV